MDILGVIHPTGRALSSLNPWYQFIMVIFQSYLSLCSIKLSNQLKLCLKFRQIEYNLKIMSERQSRYLLDRWIIHFGGKWYYERDKLMLTSNVLPIKYLAQIVITGKVKRTIIKTRDPRLFREHQFTLSPPPTLGHQGSESAIKPCQTHRHAPTRISSFYSGKQSVL